MKPWNCFQRLTQPEKRHSSVITRDRELPCLVENNDGSGDDLSDNEFSQNSKLGQLANDSIEEFHPKSCLRFMSKIPTTKEREYPLNIPDMKCWKRPQIYHVPTIPPKLWKVIAKLVGIPLNPSDIPYFATILHILTCTSALSFIISNFWYTAYDVASNETERTALKGVVELVIYFFWALLAIYSHKLAYRMFTHQSFVKYVKMHSKTILKCKSGYLITLFGIAFSTLHGYSAYYAFQPTNCDAVDLNNIVCSVSMVSFLIFSIFALTWNLLVALLILSVCRTHCLEIRQFIKELEKDALAHDELRRRTYSTSTITSHIFDETVEMEDIDSHSSSDETEPHNSNSDQIPAIYIVPDYPKSNTKRDNFQNTFSTSRQNAKYSDLQHNDNFLKPEEILHRIWKLQCSLRLTSSAFKRWVVCFLCICVIWLAVCLISWLSSTPTPLSIALFLIPLIFFAILSSAIAEVNNECQRTLRFLCPTEDRLKMLIYLNDAPLQMAIYGFAIKYSNLVTSAIGLVVALMSGVVLQEVKSI